jgi:hypothetical protein
MSYRLLGDAPPPALITDTRPHVSRVYPGDPEYDRIRSMVQRIDEADADADATPMRAAASMTEQIADAMDRQRGVANVALRPGAPPAPAPSHTSTQTLQDQIADEIERQAQSTFLAGGS